MAVFFEAAIKNISAAASHVTAVLHTHEKGVLCMQLSDASEEHVSISWDGGIHTCYPY